MANRLEQTTEESAQSFVLRLWQEEPGRWRGRIRHVQSQAQQGFTSVSQATAFVEQQLQSATRFTRATREHDAVRHSPILEWLPRSRSQVASIAAALLVVCFVALFAVGPNASAPLAGTAAVSVVALSGPGHFLAGVAVGGLVVSLLNRSKR